MEKVQANRILIVDDSPDQRFLLKMLLEAKGYTTDCTPNGKEALTFLRSCGELPQTILLDMNMDVMGGYEFRQLQCDDPLLRDIPVVVVSGEEDVNSVRVKMKSEVVRKPLNTSILLDALKRSSRLHLSTRIIKANILLKLRFRNQKFALINFFIMIQSIKDNFSPSSLILGQTNWVSNLRCIASKDLLALIKTELGIEALHRFLQKKMTTR